jgi:hypothetical protein
MISGVKLPLYYAALLRLPRCPTTPLSRCFGLNEPTNQDSRSPTSQAPPLERVGNSYITQREVSCIKHQEIAASVFLEFWAATPFSCLPDKLLDHGSRTHERVAGFFNYKHIRFRVPFLDMISKEPPEDFQFPEELEQVLFTHPDHTISTSTEHPSVQASI